MTIELRLSSATHVSMLTDLHRPNSFGGERVGFCKTVRTSTHTGTLVLITDYTSVADEHYMEANDVGARINQEALLVATNAAYLGRSQRIGLMHVHLHDHNGPTGLSRTDAESIPDIVAGWRSISPSALHGILILSRDHAYCALATGPQERFEVASRVAVVGPRLEIFENKRSRHAITL